MSTTLRSPGGEVAEEVELRVGFRSVEIRGLDLLLNGRRGFIRGVNRHDFNQHTGRVVTRDQMRADLDDLLEREVEEAGGVTPE